MVWLPLPFVTLFLVHYFFLIGLPGAVTKLTLGTEITAIGPGKKRKFTEDEGVFNLTVSVIFIFPQVLSPFLNSFLLSWM